jgi:hypothetical protein
MEKTVSKECVETPTCYHISSIQSSVLPDSISEGCVNLRLVERGSRCEGKWKTEYAMMVKQLLSGSVYGWVFRQRKESFEAKLRTE